MGGMEGGGVGPGRESSSAEGGGGGGCGYCTSQNETCVISTRNGTSIAMPLLKNDFIAKVSATLGTTVLVFCCHRKNIESLQKRSQQIITLVPKLWLLYNTFIRSCTKIDSTFANSVSPRHLITDTKHA